MRATASGLPLAIVGAAALLLAACGDSRAEATPTPTTESAATTSATEPGTVASATATTAPSATAIPAVRNDDLTGAPAPPLAVDSAEIDAHRINTGAGRFPPLNDPAIVEASEAGWLEGDTLVLGAEQNGEARAYPIGMMRFHHVSNDILGGEPYLVTF